MLQFDIRVTVHKITLNEGIDDSTDFDYSKDTQENIQDFIDGLIEQKNMYNNYYFTIAKSEVVK